MNEKTHKTFEAQLSFEAWIKMNVITTSHRGLLLFILFPINNTIYIVDKKNMPKVFQKRKEIIKSLLSFIGAANYTCWRQAKKNVVFQKCSTSRAEHEPHMGLLLKE